MTTGAATRGARHFRLTGLGAFEALFRGGRRHEGNYLQLIAASAARKPGRVGFVIGKRALPLAVDRNRVRRMLREACRARRPTIEGYDVILRLKVPAPRTEFRRIAAEAHVLLARLATPEAPR